MSKRRCEKKKHGAMPLQFPKSDIFGESGKPSHRQGCGIIVHDEAVIYVIHAFVLKDASLNTPICVIAMPWMHTVPQKCHHAFAPKSMDEFLPPPCLLD
jgi:hypothetical protein